MKKIAAIFDGLKFSRATLQYALAIAEKEPVHITGIFLDDFIYNSFSMYKMITAGATEKQIRQLEEEDRKKRNEAASIFEKTCKQEGVRFTVHRDKNIAIQDVLHESIFADMLIVGYHESFREQKQAVPTTFIKDLLAEVQCPVLLVPQDYIPVKKARLLYDGEPSSVYAIKMSTYLMPWLNTLPVEVLSINEKGTSLHLDDNRLMKELMKRHYPKATYKILQGNAESKILSQLKTDQDTTVVVLGAYRRGSVSRWLRESMADILMRELKSPLFIAHNK